MTRVKQFSARIIGAIVLLAGGITAYELWPQRLPPTDASTVELVKFCTTDQFGRLSDQMKMKYLDELMLKRGWLAMGLAASEAKLTDEEKERGIDYAMQAYVNVRLGAQLDEWLKLDEKGKKAYVKKLVASMPPRQGNGPGPGGRMGPPGGRGMTPTRVKNFVENTSPAHRAAMPEFMAAVRKERDAAAH